MSDADGAAGERRGSAAGERGGSAAGPREPSAADERDDGSGGERRAIDAWRATLRETLAALAAHDRALRRFGAAHHRYELAPPLSPGEAGALGELPEDYRAFVVEVGAGGAGPYYGLIDAARAAGCVVEAPAGVAAWRRALPLAHVGCGYAALLALDGAARGEVWIDARALGLVAPIRPSFTAFYLDWIERVARGAWLDGFVPPGQCALAGALGGYLGVWEQRLGLASGAIEGDALREALGQLGPGAIEIAAEGPLALFAPGDRVDPCVTCARLLENLGAQGLRSDVLAPGLPPRPCR